MTLTANRSCLSWLLGFVSPAVNWFVNWAINWAVSWAVKLGDTLLPVERNYREELC